MTHKYSDIARIIQRQMCFFCFVLFDQTRYLIRVTARETSGDNLPAAFGLYTDVGKDETFRDRHTSYRAEFHPTLLAAYDTRFAINEHFLLIIDDNLIGENGIAIARNSACCKFVDHDYFRINHEKPPDEDA